MEKYKCEIKNGYLIVPEQIEMSEGELIVTTIGGELRIYTPELWKKECETIKEYPDERVKSTMMRLFFSDAEETVMKDRRIKLACKAMRCLEGTDTEIFSREGVIVVSAVNADENQ